MSELRYTLLTDGPSDEALVPVLTWLLSEYLPETAIQAQWADLRKLRGRPRHLPERMHLAVELFPCELLFVHRDAERDPPEARLLEIHQAFEAARLSVPHLCVIPVRMMEAWFLFDAAAIRRAAGNPNGDIPLDLPDARRVEYLPDPKEVLHRLLREASGLTGRRLKNLNVSVRRIAGLIEDFSPLRHLPAFQRLEKDVSDYCRNRRTPPLAVP